MKLIGLKQGFRGEPDSTDFTAVIDKRDRIEADQILVWWRRRRAMQLKKGGS